MSGFIIPFFYQKCYTEGDQGIPCDLIPPKTENTDLIDFVKSGINILGEYHLIDTIIIL